MHGVLSPDELVSTGEEVALAYRPVGQPAAVWLQGSLVMGYTRDADLDVMMLWDQELPERHEIVRSLDSVEREPWVVDYRDVHIERFDVRGQEVNVGHRALGDFEADIERVCAGELDRGERVLDPLIATSGFAYGTPIIDWPVGRARLRPFPEALRTAVLRAAPSPAHLDDLERFALQDDGLQFDRAFLEAVEAAARCAFVNAGIFFPGTRWIQKAMVRFVIDLGLRRAYDATVAEGVPRLTRLEALRLLCAMVTR